MTTTEPHAADAGGAARSEAITQFRRGIEVGDAPTMLGALTPDAFLRSPVAARLRFEGHDQLAQLFAVTTDIYEDIDVAHDFGDDASWVLAFQARIGRQRFHEMLLLGLADDGRIEELTATIRPLPGVAVIAAAVGRRLARRHGLLRAAALGALTAPLVRMARSGETIGPKLIGSLGDDGR